MLERYNVTSVKAALARVRAGVDFTYPQEGCGLCLRFYLQG